MLADPRVRTSPRPAPTVALIVPVYNEVAQLPSLLELLPRLADRAEVVVVDGGSDDGSTDLLAQAAAEGSFRWLPAPKGRASQMNAGACATAAPVLLFLHADTWLEPEALAEAAAAVEAGAVGGCFRLRIDSPDLRLRLAARLINLRSRILASASGDQGIFVARRAFERVGGFRDLKLCEDLDLVARLGALGRFVLIDRAVKTSARRWQRCGVSRTIALMWGLRVAYHLGIHPSTLERLYGDVR